MDHNCICESRFAALRTRLALLACFLLTPGLSIRSATAGEASFSAASVVDGSFAGAFSVVVADVNKDGANDVVGAAFNADEIAWWANNGKATAWTKHSRAVDFGGAICAGAQDMNGDGKMDILGAFVSGGSILWWENEDGFGDSWKRHFITSTPGGGPRSFFPADINGDGKTDVAAAFQDSNSIVWFKNVDGKGEVWEPHTVGANFPFAMSARVSAINRNDSHAHIFAAAGKGNEIAWWKNKNGDGLAWDKHSIDANFAGASCVFPVDVDGDNDTDVFGAGQVDDMIAWWENLDGEGGAWARHPVARDFDGAASVYAADLNGDGKVEVVGAAVNAGNVAYWKRDTADGKGSWTMRTIDTSFAGAASVYVADLDGDKAPDVVGASSVDNRISWWKNTTPLDSLQILPEPSFTRGTANTVSWTTGTESTAYQYEVQNALAEDFTPALNTITLSYPVTSYTFSNLADGTKYFYRVRARDAFGRVGDWSATVSSTQDNTPPSGTISVNSDESFTNSPNVTLTLNVSDAVSGVKDMQFSSDGATWSDWEPFATSKAWTLAGGDGVKTVYARFHDNVDNQSAPISDDIFLDTQPPAGAIVINRGAPFTNTKNVTLSLSASDPGPSASGVALMRFSNDGVNWSAWEPFAPTKLWTLTDGDAVKTVSVQYQDKAANLSTAASDSITLDTTLPQSHVTAPNGVATTWGLTLQWTANDPGAPNSGVVSVEILWRRDEGSPESLGKFPPSITSIPFDANDHGGDGIYDFRSIATDRAGNMESKLTWDTRVEVRTGELSFSAILDYLLQKHGLTAQQLLVGDANHDGKIDVSDILPGVWANRTPAPVMDAEPALTSGSENLVSWSAVNVAAIYDVQVDDAADFATPIATISVNAPGKGHTFMGLGDGLTYWYRARTIDAFHHPSDWSLAVSSRQDGTLPVGTISINDSAAYTATSEVTLALTATDGGNNPSGVESMRFSNDGATWSAWETFAPTKAWTLAAGDGVKTVYAQYRDVSGNVSATVSDAIAFDSTPPGGTVAIDGGATYATTGAVALALTATDTGAGASGVESMRLSNDGAVWSEWEPFATSRAWTLASGDGAKTVSVEYRDRAGNVSPMASDSITLDSTPPSGTVVIDGSAAFTKSASVTLTLSATDIGAGHSGVSQMRFSNDGVTWSVWEAFATSKAWTLAGGDGVKTVYAQYQDAAGNVSTAATDAITLDTAPPAGTILIDGEAPATSVTAVTLTISFSDPGTDPSGLSQMQLSNDGVTWTAWESFAPVKAWTLEVGESLKHVYVKVRDAAGNISDVGGDTIILDATAPSVTVVVDGNATYTSSPAVTLALTASDGGFIPSGVARMRLSNDGVNWTAWAPYATTAAWTLTTSDGAKTVRAQVMDVAGNPSSAASDDITLDSTPPSATVVIDGGAAYTSVTAVTLTLTANDTGPGASGVAQMRFRNGTSGAWSAWEPFATAKQWTLASGDGAKTVQAQVRDVAGNLSSAASDDITLDSTAPTATVIINGGAAYTSVTAVTLTLTANDTGPGASGVAQMRFNNDGGAWSAWEPFATAKSWTLASGDGTKTVQAQVRDVAGNPSSAASDDITLDSTVPTATVIINGGAAYTSVTAVTLTLTANDTGPGASGVAQMRFRNGTSGAWSAWEPYATAKSWTLASGDGNKTVQARVRDAAGNLSSTASDSITLDSTPPSVTVVIDSGAAYTSNTAVTLTLTANDTGPGASGVEQMRFRNGTSGAWSAWEPFATAKQWTLASGDGAKTVQAQVRDVAGNLSSTASDDITLDSTPPSVTVVINGGAAYTSVTAVTLTLTANDTGPGASGVEQMRFRNGTSGSWSVWEPYATTKQWTLASGDGAKTVQAQVRDVAGNLSSAASDDITLDSTPPSVTVVINGGAAYTSVTAVTLTLTASDTGLGASGVAQMRFSNDGSSWSPLEAYATTKAWTVEDANDGIKTVFAQVVDGAGNLSASFSDTILLDTTPSSSSVYAPSGTVTTSTLTIQWAADDPGGANASGVASTEIFWAKDNGTTTSLGVFPEPDRSAPFDASEHGGNGDYAFYSVATDNAGNREAAPSVADVVVTVAVD